MFGKCSKFCEKNVKMYENLWKICETHFGKLFDIFSDCRRSHFSSNCTFAIMKHYFDQIWSHLYRY